MNLKEAKLGSQQIIYFFSLLIFRFGFVFFSLVSFWLAFVLFVPHVLFTLRLFCFKYCSDNQAKREPLYGFIANVFPFFT
jgi:hypothetical protein